MLEKYPNVYDQVIGCEKEDYLYSLGYGWICILLHLVSIILNFAVLFNFQSVSLAFASIYCSFWPKKDYE